MPKLTLLVGPPGSGKSTMAKNRAADDATLVYVNQDSQGGEHMDIFFEAVASGRDILIDRMNFNKQQRAKYLDYAKFKNPAYETEIVVLHQPYSVCLERVRARFGNHETINEEKSARGALATFFTKYERPLPDEANKLTFHYPVGEKPSAIICDLDGTLCDVEHRRHHVRPNGAKPEGFKKNWAAFFRDIPLDPVNQWCAALLRAMAPHHKIVYCSGRDSNQRKNTEEWLKKHGLDSFYDPLFESTDKADLYMRDRQDSRQDCIVKENILDFEILTRYTPFFMIDDRQQVVDMWRSRGYVCLQCDKGDF